MSARLGRNVVAPAAIGLALAGTTLLSVQGAAGRSGAEPSSTPAGDAGKVRCIYGELRDPHRGFVRCLEPDEVDASWLPPPPQDPDADVDGGEGGADLDGGPDDGGASDGGAFDGGGADGGPPAPVPVPTIVTVGEPTLTAGAIAGLAAALGKQRAALARCVGDAGGVPRGEEGSVVVRFLVRAPGKAEGVDVAQSRGVPAEGLACVKKLLQNRFVGTPSIEPIGVRVRLVFRASP